MNNQKLKHHIHVRVGEELHTIGTSDNFIEFSDLCNVLNQIVSDYNHKALHNDQCN